MKRLVSLLRTYRHRILVSSSNKIFGRFVRFETLLIYEHDLHDIAEAHRGEFEYKLADKRRFGRQFKGFSKRLSDKGIRCYDCTHGKKIIGYGWMSNKDAAVIPEANYRFNIKDNEAYLFDFHVDLDYRGRGIYPALISAMLRDLKKNGKKKAFIAVVDSNFSSIKGIKKAGFRLKSTVHYTKFLGYERQVIR